MRRVLLSYEFGAGLGHLNRLIAVAKRLRRHRLIFAVPNLAMSTPVIRRAMGDDVEVRQGLQWPPPTYPGVRQVPTHTFADTITLFGFSDRERLRVAAEWWMSQLQEVSPDLIIADFAPTLRLVSAGRLPTVVVGNGFTVPPARRLLPPMRPWQEKIEPGSRVHEGELLAGANYVRSVTSGPALDYFADLFHGERTFVCTLPEFDPYARYREEPANWPFNIPDIRSGKAVDERRGPAVFCYFQHGHPALESVLAAVSQLTVRSEIYVQGVSPSALASRCSSQVGVRIRPADFGEVLPETSVLVHHAGLATTSAGLLAGVQQLVLPLNLEHAITARGLERFGVSVRLMGNPPPDVGAVRKCLQEMLLDAPQQKVAQLAAGALAARRVADPVLPSVMACESFLV